MLLFKHMAVGYATERPTFVMTASSTPLQYFLGGSSKSVDPTAFSDVPPASGKWQGNKTTAHDEAQQAKQIMMNNLHTLIAAVHYKQKVYRESHVWEHTRIESDAVKQFTKD